MTETVTSEDTAELLPEFPLRFGEEESRTDGALAYAQLATGDPVTRVRLPSGRPAWLVTGYQEVRAVLTDARASRQAAARSDGAQVLAVERVGTSILTLDPPDHTRLRRIVGRGFTARRSEALRPRIAEMAGELLDDLAAGPRPADINEQFCMLLPVRVICELLGVPLGDRHRFEAWRDALIAPTGPDRPFDVGAHQALLAYIGELVAAKRKEPGDDLLSILAAAGQGPSDKDDALTDQEIVALGGTLLVAGFETTVAQLGLCLREILARPEGLLSVPTERTELAAEVEELVRRLPIGNFGGTLARQATEDMQVGGVLIRAGEVIVAATQAANFDPAAFPAPLDHDAARDNGSHQMAFGFGVHHCLGSPVARIEIQEALLALRTRFPGMRLAVPDEELRFVPGAASRRLERFPVTW
ncbi:cytochrome P450 [Streptomyces sp. NPDC058960]|uniref:cytochrome P450 n=1 Tax=Streptomyces sp. NPDC058960 TaxID=3346679 RepID=UPI0036A82317